MGILAGQYFDARGCAKSCGTDDRNAADESLRARRRRGWLFGLTLFWATQAAHADSFRIATYAAPLSREGPGLLLRDIAKGDDPQIGAAVSVIAHISPDVLLLTDFDYDYDLAALQAFARLFEPPFPFAFALPPNAGLPTGHDLDRNGRIGEPRDAMGYGRFVGDGGMAILSRFPIREAEVRDFSQLLWSQLPDATLPQKDGAPFFCAKLLETLRLSSSGHWIVPIDLPSGHAVNLLTFAATPPVFDGPEDHNGLRNRDELRLWELVIDGQFGPTPESFVILGNANLDPQKGDGYRRAMREFLDRPDINDPLPGLPTADWGPDGPGALRVSYVLPNAALDVSAAGVFWPAAYDPLATLLGDGGAAAGPHHLVWVDILR